MPELSNKPAEKLSLEHSTIFCTQQSQPVLHSGRRNATSHKLGEKKFTFWVLKSAVVSKTLLEQVSDVNCCQFPFSEKC